MSRGRLFELPAAVILATSPCLAQAVAGATSAPSVPPGPDLGYSLLRLAGALVFVVAVCFAGAWLFRNWQRLVVQRGQSAKLNILEVKPLGQRHALYVVAYEQERMLLAASPSGVTLVSHLPPAAQVDHLDRPHPSSFADVLKALRLSKS